MKAITKRICTIERKKARPHLDWTAMLGIFFAGFFGGYVLALISGLLR